MKIKKSDIPDECRKKIITIRKSDLPDIEPVVNPDSKKHRRIRYVLYFFFVFVPIINLILFGGSVGFVVMWILVSAGIIDGCVRPRTEWRIIRKKKKQSSVAEAEKIEQHV